MTDEQRLAFFLAGLADLREKYGMEIDGCGDCGSPWIRDVQIEHYHRAASYLEWDSKEECYTYD